MPGPLVVSSCSASPNPQRLNTNVTWSANVSGGIGNYTYVWTGADGLTGTTPTVLKSYATIGPKNASVTVTSESETKTVACTSLTVNDNKYLTVTKNPAAGGTITSSPIGINCGASCFGSYANNTSVTLTVALAVGSTFTGWSNCSTQATSPLTVTMSSDKTCTANFTIVAPPNTPPVSVAGISLDTTTFNSIVNVKKGVATTFFISAWRGTEASPSPGSSDPDGWTNTSLGMSGGSAKCEWDTDLVQNAGSFVSDLLRNNPPAYSECSDPDNNASNYLTLTKTFNDSPGTYTYYVLKMTDRAGGVSNIGTVQVKVLAQCEDNDDNDGDGLFDLADPDCSSGGDDSESTSPITLPDLTASVSAPSTAITNVDQNYTAIITNQGSASTGVSFPYFFQTATAANGGGTITDKASSTTVAALSSVVGSNTVTATSPLIKFTSAGIYSVRVCVDKTSSAGGGVIPESDEDNNCSDSWTTVTVTNAPVPVDGYYSGWSDCSVIACGQTGIETEINCVEPQYGGDPCPIPATRACSTWSCTTFQGQCPIPEKNSNKRCVNPNNTVNDFLYAGDYKAFSNEVTWTCNGWGNPLGAPKKCSEPNAPGFREN